MRYISFLFLLLSVIALSGCFRPPEFPAEPEIVFNSIVFKEGPEGDTLILAIDFQDGDGDLGLTGTDDNFPYHPVDVIKDANNDTVFFRDGVREFDGKVRVAQPPFYRVSPNGDRELFSDTDNRPTAFTCKDFEFLTAEVRETINVGGEPVERVRSITIDSFYKVPNPLHHNIYVDIKRKIGENEYVDFDFRNVARNDFCGDDFDGRFPIFDQRNFEDENALAGTIEYDMFSLGFGIAFRRDTFKLDISIRDRALNISNVVSTPDFTLESISQE
ncbi:MAG: hypothetical protein WBA74_16550 [Cyclobacteriaceae bacterium]